MTTLSRLLALRTLATVSVVHSVLFTGLMLCAFVLGKPEPATFAFGFTHGVLYLVMAVACGVAARIGTVPGTTALVVIVLGALGPYFGTFDLLREVRQRGDDRTAQDAGHEPASLD